MKKIRKKAANNYLVSCEQDVIDLIKSGVTVMGLSKAGIAMSPFSLFYDNLEERVKGAWSKVHSGEMKIDENHSIDLDRYDYITIDRSDFK